MTKTFDNPPLYETFISKSRYARYLDDQQRRENWDETVTRYMDFMRDHLEHKHSYTMGESLYSELKNAIVDLEVMPSMRALMTAGKALGRDNTAGYNCFARETEFITDQGIKSFVDFEDGDQTTVVVTADSLRPATVRRFGTERLYKLTVQRGAHDQEEIFTTANHRWPTENDAPPYLAEFTTINLKPGMLLSMLPSNGQFLEKLTPCKVGIMHGLVFSNGSKQHEDPRSNSRIVLCGDSTALTKHFISGRIGELKGEGISAHQRIDGLPWTWKELPSLNANREYLLGFLMGWFAIDGGFSDDGANLYFRSEHKANLDWFRSAAAILEIITWRASDSVVPNSADPKRLTILHTANIDQATLPKFFFLKEKHAETFASYKQKNMFRWTVVSVEETDRIEDVWCVQVPDIETFTLAQGIQTRNCSYLPIDDLKAFDEAMYILLCFAPETLVSVKGEVKPISELTVDDQVLSYNEHNGKYSYIKPSKVFETPTAQSKKLELTFEDGTIVRVTDNHPFLTDERGWVEAKNLTEDDEIVHNPHIKQDTLKDLTKNFSCEETLLMQSSMKITKKVEIEDARNYWDITVPKNHTFVLANGCVVHNCGTGVGFSVERQYVNKLPEIPERIYDSETTVVVSDSKEGWAKALRQIISLLYSGEAPQWNTHKVRPAGTRLKTFGGRSSGPEPLISLFEFVTKTFKNAQGRKLNSLECHDIMCKIGEVVVVGGVRRCLPGDTLVQIGENEWKSICEMAAGDLIYIGEEFHHVSNTFDQGEQEVLKIELEDGTFLESTPNHKWLVFNRSSGEREWVMTKDLTGDHGMIDD